MQEQIERVAARGIPEKFKIPVQPKAIEHIRIGRQEQIHLSSTLGPFVGAPEYITDLPSHIIAAMGELVMENAQTFSHFVPRNTESDPLAYNHCVVPGGLVTEPFFQVDMVGMDRNMIAAASTVSVAEVREKLRSSIFEFEPSIAMYEVIQTFGGGGILKGNFRQHLDMLRERHGRPIAILAPTQEKFAAVLATEFGLVPDHGLSQQELNAHVQEVSGFDTLMGPDDFIEHVNQQGSCDFLLYVRPSDPIEKLKDPSVQVHEPLLGTATLRKLIRQQALTLNIDNPAWKSDDPRRIKDSKAALPLMGMGQAVRSCRQLSVVQTNSDTLLRAKPRGGVFGAYGQKIIEPRNEGHVSWLAAQIQHRGAYLIQPEMAPLMIADQTTGEKFLALDRNFFSLVTGEAVFLGGLRILIPVESKNARNGRLHGSDDMITAPIVAGL